jgi:hypothetical protein
MVPAGGSSSSSSSAGKRLRSPERLPPSIKAKSRPPPEKRLQRIPFE